MLRATYLFVFGIVITFATLAFSQETSIDNALAVSQRTGKPVFAIASRRVCPPCNLLKSRVSTFLKTSPHASKVVYLRVDIDGPAWGEWSRRFPHQGRMLPLVYLIRADQTQLYAKSNTLPGEQLEKFIVQGAAHAGQSFSDQEIRKIEASNKAIRTALKSNQIQLAHRELLTTSVSGKPGTIESFAKAAQEHNVLIKEVAAQSVPYVTDRLEIILGQLKADTDQRFAAVSEFVKLESMFNNNESVGKLFSPVAVQLAINEDLRGMWKEARILNEAKSELAAGNMPGNLKLIQTISESSSAKDARTAALDIISSSTRIAANTSRNQK